MAPIKSPGGLLGNYKLHLQNLNQIRVTGLTDRHAGRQYDNIAFFDVACLDGITGRGFEHFVRRCDFVAFTGMTPESKQILASTSSCRVTAIIGAFGRYFEIIRAVNPLSLP